MLFLLTENSWTEYTTDIITNLHSVSPWQNTKINGILQVMLCILSRRSSKFARKFERILWRRGNFVQTTLWVILFLFKQEGICNIHVNKSTKSLFLLSHPRLSKLNTIFARDKRKILDWLFQDRRGEHYRFVKTAIMRVWGGLRDSVILKDRELQGGFGF